MPAAMSRTTALRLAVKVPEITAGFWVIKVLTTGAGEAASDYLAAKSLVLAAGVGLVGFAAALAVQLRARHYVPWVYWSAVSAVAVFGTMAADAVHVVLGVPYPVTSVAYALCVALAFVVWHRAEGTLDIHTVTPGRREIFYWVTVLATFALGTAVGDLSAFTLHLGYSASAVLYAVLIAVPALAWWRLRLNAVVAFWAAYVLTRPLGASVADWLGKPSSRSGLGLGDGTVTVVAAIAIAVLVASLSRRSAQPESIEDAADDDRSSSTIRR
jgi:uncharacterized membrane-anchored protein